LVTVGLFAVALAAAGCGGGSSSSTSTSAKPSRGFTGTTARGSEPSIKIGNQAFLLRDNTIFLTVDYTCPTNHAEASISVSVNQGGTQGVALNVPTTCDGGSHTAGIDIGPGSFTEGVAGAVHAALHLNTGGVGADSTLTPRAPNPSDNAVTINSHALLLTDGSVVYTISYRCLPGPGPNTAGMLEYGMSQGPNISQSNGTSAICDDSSHSASVRNVVNLGPGPFGEGPATASAITRNSERDPGGGEFVSITVSSSTTAHAPASR
jgi:hypothetical protein